MTFNKKADISIPFILGMILIIVVLIVMLYFVYGYYEGTLSDSAAKIFGAM